jgi:hypothetical protein
MEETQPHQPWDFFLRPQYSLRDPPQYIHLTLTMASKMQNDMLQTWKIRTQLNSENEIKNLCDMFVYSSYGQTIECIQHNQVIIYSPNLLMKNM